MPSAGGRKARQYWQLQCEAEIHILYFFEEETRCGGAPRFAERIRTMSKRVLIVDDSMLMRRMIGESLADDGWEIVAEAGNGQEAIEQFEQVRPDAVTLDIVMPGTDGMYALDHILQLDPDAKLVVVSALNQTKMISEAIRKGAQDFIAKPFLPEQLQETMNRCLDLPVGI